jgi:hypothetical protein
MPVDVKGRVSYNKEADEPYMIDCKQLDISETGSGDIEQDIEDLRGKVTRAISEEFKVEPSTVQITGYSMSLNFSIEGPINHTLDHFTNEKEGVTHADE